MPLPAAPESKSLPNARAAPDRKHNPSGLLPRASIVTALPESTFAQYMAAFTVFVVFLLLNPGLEKLIGYEAVALVNLLAVVVLALFVNRGAILFGTTLTAFGWGFLAPPRFSFHITSFYDKMMMVTYFVVALTIGQLMARLRAHRETEMKARLVAESERLSRTLLNSVSHEFRTPIAVITTAASELRASGALNPAQQKLTDEIETAGARLNRVVKSLLNAARLQSGQIRPKIDWCDVSDLLRVTLQEVAEVTSGRVIEEKITPGLPLVKMDIVLMQQALANLLVNASQYTPAGTAIQISARMAANDLILEVAYSGPGLPPDELERIFDLFHRAPGAKAGGTGLGLAIVKGFVEAQGGRVGAANRPAGGALFTISMPAGNMPNVPDAQEEPL